ncbi:MAG: DNA repair protein RecO [Acholeplasmataceae bacterium]|nr:DNA repair protein RecO [Acholeplasmataceae bacterium]
MIGLIYKTQPYQETNRMLFVYTKKGKKTLIARGSQRLSSELRLISQYLNLIEFYDNGKKMQSLTDAKLLDDYQKIKKDFFKTKLVAAMLEAIDKVRDEEIDHELVLEELIKSINSNNLNAATLSFLIKLISQAGYAPNFEADGRVVRGFNLELGIIVYEKDVISIDLNVQETIILMKLLNLDVNDLEEIDQNYFESISQFIKKYYEYHLRVSLKNI